MFKHVLVNHIFLLPENYDLNFVQPYEAALNRLAHNNDLWWTSKGVDLTTTPNKTHLEGTIDRNLENPWYETFNWLQVQNFYDPSQLYVVFLKDWYSVNYAGWGGRPLAVVGDYALNAFASANSPEGIWDDTKAGYLVMHEQGHAMGLQHDFNTRDAIMSYDWKGYNSILGATSDAALRSQPLMFGDVIPQPEGCQLIL